MISKEKAKKTIYTSLKIGVFLFLMQIIWNQNLHSSKSPIQSVPQQFLISAPPLPSFLPLDSPSKLSLEKATEGSFLQEKKENDYRLPPPKNVERKVSYDPATGKYKVTEKVEGIHVRPPMYLTYEEYADMVAKEQNNAIIKSRNTSVKDATKLNNGKDEPVEIEKPNEQGLFGIGGVEIKPQGNLITQMGYNHNIIRNPNISPIQQSQGVMDFDMNINLSVTGKIGDRFQNTLRYNNQAGFGFEGQRIRLAYTGKEDDIVRLLEAGDVNFDLPTQLITGTQSLFGIKSELQFGKVNIKTVLSQQRSNKQSKVVENGAEIQNFEIYADQYDVNRHFFLSQYFRDNFEKALKNFPLINSQIQVTQCEVWITNRNAVTQSIRDAIAFQDMGEVKPFSDKITSLNQIMPDNVSNDLYPRINRDENVRNVNTALNQLQTVYGLQSFKDFEKSFMRKLSPSEFVLNPQLGTISLNTNIQNNDVLAVSFQYVHNGKVYQVGDISRDITLPDTSSPDPSRLIYLKLLKGANVNPTYPVWDLMMKNVYSLNAFQVGKDNFRLDVFYNDPGGGLKRYLPKGKLQDAPMIRVFNLDRLNQNQEPYSDGVFDFVPDITIFPNNGKIMFPVLEPFGSHLRQELIKVGDAALAREYVYQQLYDSTQFIAQQFPEFNRFVIKGTYQSASNKRVSLGAFGVPQGSVTVSLNGQRLQEGSDYTIEYGLGYVELADHILSSGGRVQVDFENNAMFSLQQRNFMGVRAEYRAHENFKFGSTWQKLAERPFNNKIQFGEDPISNQIVGADLTFNTKAPFITRLIDKLPFYKTNESSHINFYGEVAHLIPGHYNSIGDEGTIYIDDFEGAVIGYGFGFPANVWRLSSTPSGARDASGKVLFPESNLYDSLPYGYNRAKLSWYNIANGFFFSNSNFPSFDNKIRNNVYMRPYRLKHIFPQRQRQQINDLVQTFDIAYYPREKGPYNYESSPSPTPGISMGINSDHSLKVPESRWGGIQRSIENSNFESNNVEFVEFWLLDPFIKNKNNKGDLYFNLGYISEDVLKDGRMGYEHGLYDKNGSKANLMAKSKWATVPNVTPIVRAFDNDPTLRPLQDIGYDGYNNNEESAVLGNYLQSLQAVLNPDAYQKALKDPSNDDFEFYLSKSRIDAGNNIIGLYKNFNNPEGNSPTDLSGGVPQSSYATPDNEDINNDNTINENESYFQYRVPLFPGMNEQNHPYIVSKTVSVFDANEPEPDGDSAVWYQIRIPVKNFDHKVGNIGDFRNIQFVRMFLTNFKDSAILRMVEMNFIRSQWIKYNGNLRGPTDFLPQDDNENEYFNLGGVSIEENASKQPVNYISPAGIVREVGVNTTANAIQLNEQALRMSFCNLKEADAKAAFKNLQFDFRQFNKIRVFFHAESNPSALSQMNDDDVTAFIRLGADFKENYYEYEIPLKVTPFGSYNGNLNGDQRIVWPDSNEMIIPLQELVDVKLKRNASRFPINTPFIDHSKVRNVTIVGNPDIGRVKMAMVGVRNRAVSDKANFKPDDDGMPKCGEVWVNELRLEGLNEEGGTAALANMSIKLADLGTANLTAQMHTIGFGQVHQRVNERMQDDYYQIGINSNLQFGKFFPKKWGVQMPFFVNYTRGVSTPRFDPFTMDINSKRQAQAVELGYGSDSASAYLDMVQTTDTRSGFNFTNVRIVPESKNNKIHPFHIRNFSASYAFSSIKRTSPFIASDWIRNYMGELNYSFAAQPKYIEPFKNITKSKKRVWDVIKSFNFNLVPTNMTVSNRLDRQFGVFQQRRLPDETSQMPNQYLKNFTWNRRYAFDYNPTRPVSINFSASNNARVDEPQGGLNNPGDVDSIWSNLRRLGRTTQYSQQANASYNLPLNKIPILDFTTASVRYGSGFNWNIGPQILDDRGELVQSPQGNVIDNSQNLGFTANFKMAKLYQKLEALKKVDIDSRDKFAGLDKEQKEKRIEQLKLQIKNAEERVDKAKEKLDKLKEEKKALKKNDSIERKVRKELLTKKKAEIKKQKEQVKKLKEDLKKIELPISPIIKAVAQPLMAIREVEGSYNITNTTTLPGFTQNTKYFGMDLDQTNHLDPGFVFGMQPGIPLLAPPDKYARMRWLDDAAEKDWITRDTLFNLPFMQSNMRKFTGRMVIEPYKHIKVNLKWESDYTQRYTEIFRYNEQLGTFEHLNPIESGSYTYSDINLLTSFDKIRNGGRGANLERFNENRRIYASIMNELNPNGFNNVYIDPITGIPVPGFYQGYGPLQGDVLVNAFLTTYRGTTPEKSKESVSPFSRIPLPNWDITYTGLKELKFLKKHFTLFTLKHGYSANTTISSFNSDIRYFGGGDITNPIRIDSVNNNFIPFYYIPQVSMSESYNPLIGIDFAMKNSLRFNFSIRSRRQVAMSLIDYMITENNSNDVSLGCGFRVKNFVIPFFKNANGRKIKLENDLNVDIQFTLGDNEIVNYRMGQNIENVVGGAFRWMLSPKIDYKVNDKINLTVFYNHTFQEPKLSNSFPQTNISGGVKMNFSLAP